jgi:hypothetical protein
MGEAHRLDPVRLRPSRLRPLIRYAVVAALLTLAAGTLFLDPPSGTAKPAACRTRGADAKPSRQPAPGTGDRPAALPVPSGLVGVPVQLAEPATAGVLRPGDRIDLIARTAGVESAEPGDAAEDVVLARDVLVLSVDLSPDRSPDEVVLYVAMARDRARDVARTAPSVPLGITVRPR